MSSIFQKVIVTPGDHEEWIRAINAAEELVEMEMFTLTDMKVVAALNAAGARNVKRQIVLNGSTLSHPHNQAASQSLKDNGSLIYPSSDAFAITHSKMMRVDKKISYAGTMNLTNAVAYTRDFTLVTNDDKIGTDISSTVACDIKNSGNGGKENPNLVSPLVFISPVNALQRLLSRYRSAKSKLDLCSENFGDPDVQQTLMDVAAKEGMVVRVLGPMYVEADAYEDQIRNYKFLKALKAAGVLVKVMPNPSTPDTPYLHAKYDLIDEKSFSNHSQNNSYSSLRLSREFGIEGEDEWVVSQESPYYEKDWAAAVDLPDQPPPEQQKAA